MRYVALVFLSLTALIAAAEEPTTPPATKGTKIYQTDAYGRIRYDKPSWVVKDDGRIVQIKPVRTRGIAQAAVRDQGRPRPPCGREWASAAQQTVLDGRQGRARHSERRLGNPQYHKPQYVNEDGKVYATDATGQVKRPAYEIKK